ncbi:MAG: SRPBCC family protein [Actinomycetota bacterium]|nr:SRPBCC family protein [Actinomycetota bacterium]
MSTVTATAHRTVDAPAGVVFGCLSDYREHHPRFLPPAFSEYRVEEGGTGDGTVVSFAITAGGRSRRYRMRVVVPEPGRVLEERDTASSLVTRFVLAPDGSRTNVRIETTWKGAGGIGGFFERMFAPAALKRIYDDELARLDAYAREQRSA